MRFSKMFYGNSDFNQDNQALELIDLMRKACFVHQGGSGLYSWLDLGLRLEACVTSVIREEMASAGFSEMRLSLLQDADLWEATGRMAAYGEELFRLKNRKGHSFCLGATCEEAATALVKSHCNGTDMSVRISQIGNKYRDELRARSGLIRSKEFVMQDAYAFHASEADLQEAYQQTRAAYGRVLERLGLAYSIEASDNGEMGGKSSEEFHVQSAFGEQRSDGSATVEVAHIFNLGTAYSEAFGLVSARRELALMACFGMGVSRLVMILLEKQRDAAGFWGSAAFRSFDDIVTVLDAGRQDHLAAGQRLKEELEKAGRSALLDDRIEQAGKKLADSELIGCRRRIVVSKRALASGQVEILDRASMSKSYCALSDAALR